MTAKRQKQKTQEATSNPRKKAVDEASERHGVKNWFEKLRERQAERRSQLENQHRFVSECDKLLEEFECAYLECPKLLNGFLRVRPMGQTTRASKDWLEKNVKSPALARILNRYVNFSNRYSVYFRQLPNEPRFEWRVSDPLGWKFRARVSHGAVVPANGTAPLHLAEAGDFMDANLQVQPSVQKLIDERKMKFVQIEDTEDATLLSELESLGYYDSGATFFLHRSPRPHLWCLVGEHLRKKDWKELAKVVTDFHKLYFGGAKAGRPRDIALAAGANRVLKMTAQQKVMAADMNPAVSPSSAQSYLSRHIKRENKRKSDLDDLRQKLRKECSQN